MNLRQQWRDFIVSPQRVSRHFASIGAAVTAELAPTIDDPILADFLKRLVDGPIGTEFLAGIIDLLGGKYDVFCTRDLPALLDSLANDNVATNSVVGPALRGNTRWDLTYTGRLSGRLSPAQFVTRLPVRNFGLPENELVSWLVADLMASVSSVEARVGSSSTPRQLRLIRDACKEALKHPWFKEVVPPRALDTHMQTSAMRRRLPAYRSASALAQQRNAFRTRDRIEKWKHIVTLLSANWLSPVSDDDLFELYALALVLDVLEHECGFGPPVEFGLNVSGRSHVARFQKQAEAICVFFDQSPVSFLNAPSRQLEILDAHEGMRPHPRRPDITIVHSNGASSHNRVHFVEVKKTSDGSYISDSLYKAFGYLKDFAALWRSTDANPKVTLLVPENVSFKGGDLSTLEVVFVSSMDRNGLRQVLTTALLT
ncbi:hypothetical protein ACVME8_003548 [Bradyrhizobium diazoefficiens]